LLGVTGALALACFVKVCGVVFLGAPRSEAAAHAHECGRSMRAAMLLLAGACVAIGLAPVLFWPAIAHAAGAWQPEWAHVEIPAPLSSLGRVHVALAMLASIAMYLLWRRVAQNGLRRAATWDCGYAVPTARMQYTAGSFAGILTEWFAWILRPERHEQRVDATFPLQASWTEHTPETVLEHVVVPSGGVVMRASAAARSFQHGRVQSYLFYLLISLMALAALVVLGGKH